MNSKNTELFMKDFKNLIDYFNKNVKVFLINNTNVKYEFKSNIMDGLLYLLLNTKKDATHLNSAINISKFNKINITRQSLDKRSNHISLKNIKQLNNEFYNKFLKEFSDNLNHTDGLNINIYDPNESKGYKTIKLLSVVNDKDIPHELHINKDIYKSEIKLFYDFIENGKYETSKHFVVDKLYFSDKFTNKMTEKNLTFIARMKKNSSYLNKFKIDLKNNIFNDDYEVANKKGIKIRIINFKVNNKNYHIATNLLNKEQYNISFFKNAYKKRWSVELFIKITKGNTNLESIKIKKDIKLEIHVKIISLLTMIYNYIINLYKKYSKTDKKINNSQFIKSFYDDLLFKIIKGKFNKKELIFLFMLFFVLYNDSNKQNNERKGIMPYKSKWHYKSTFKKDIELNNKKLKTFDQW